MARKLVIASNNKGKIAELTDLLAPLGLQPVAQGELGVSEAEEPAVTFVENAIIKARHAARVTGLPALADDSGLAVDALDGRPGVRSARFAGEEATDNDNVEALLAALKDTPEAERSAQFHCVLVYLRHADDPTPIICHGRWPGRILAEPRGQGGFGYDPVFLVPEHGCSAAELTREQKGRISHRGRALASLLDQLRAEL
ncbi:MULTISPECIES: RdgB/HAM1 family non-canonical purine NTP pyrophosphatase [Marinobacter]|jgi:XTP/dITP diphosphohydrolase|uniref:dITP/XTP pyrophosphatase n=1 Tax=Marinobacter nauticus (strain ATCC 700491 / DSM 11845 / VT8) TaxID=351348 RepID=A1TY11_MARN8|nr:MULTISPECIES: RdgB/HAM1 family non-canonical purine NTP pyrophosphatase [Marinobacter]MEC8898816.1 RdgB/HAM1 family non-canonical purine NTP pyrophosphatase [Pseudomonadota bacterium]ABM17630.1 non-canonical purine NTP pyrophosphatase, rdgB/HAM1 family [Marinobacter nauticus VT8]MBU41041.1 non-canonical purine NTP pyrophosphatase [Marinobacter sp.]MBY6193812.1 RdgB/HAM1 family non-canonical purine NTP pyrophosphatase [Marinobacter nauticus]MBY6214959.1 RdgB/HAM1 family non-canonical purine |tara:strand:- start:391 stop:990 length:600 start_codon:yes stop_codon:yes gene_type:complete